MRHVPLASILLSAWAVAGVSDRVALAQSDGALCINRDYLGSIDTPGQAYDVAFEGSTAFVADYHSVQIIDLSDTQNPVWLATYDPPGFIESIFVQDGIAYIPASAGGLHVLDVSDPAQPALISIYNQSSGIIEDIELVGSIGYAVDRVYGLLVLDLSDPSSPILLGSYADGHGDYDLWRLDVRGTYAYVTDRDWGFRVFDVSDAAAPLLAGELRVGAGLFDVELVGTTAYVTDFSKRITIIDVSIPSQPVLAGVFDAPETAAGLQVDGSRMLVGGGFGAGLVVLDVSTPDAPKRLSSYAMPHPTLQPRLLGSIAAVTQWAGGLQLMDVSDPKAPSLIGQYDAPGSGTDLIVEGRTAYIAAGLGGIHALDIIDPSEPVLLDVFDSQGSVSGLELDGQTLYVADGSEGLAILDVSMPSSMTQIGSFTNGNPVYDVAVRGDVAYLANGARLFLLDVSDPAAPERLGWVTSGGVAKRIVVRDDVAYVACDDGWFATFEVSDPLFPTLLGKFQVADQHLRDFALHGDLAYVAAGCFDCEVPILDVSDPTDVTVVGTMAEPGTSAVAVRDGRLYRAGAFGPDSTLDVYDLSNPLAPQFLGWHQDAFPRRIVPVLDTVLFVDEDGLKIANLSDCPPCPADFDSDGDTDTHDIITFLNAWVSERTQDCSSGGCSTDLDANGLVDTRDFVAFLNAWAAGC